jgi:putative endonuclease
MWLAFVNDIVRRIHDTDKKATAGVTSKYNITRLVWFEI